jgi:3-methyladenine DNA glycosylase/8-oxoguanine DNA glycosylase
MYRHAKLHFKKADPILYRAARLHKIADIRRSSDVFGDLVHAIVNQQLSGKAADTIYVRLETIVGAITPRTIASLSIPMLRKCGLSEAKTKSIKELAKTVVDKKLDLANIHLHEDEKIVELLTAQKGIGPWTAEMILMFSLGRQDIFSKGDLGLKKGIMRLYGLRKMPSDRTMDRLAKAWSPYRTYAALVLWRVADGEKGTW